MMEQVKIKCWKEIGTAGDGSCEKLRKYYHCRNCPEFSKSGRKILDRQTKSDSIKEWTNQFSKSKQIEQTGRLSVALFRVRQQWLALRTKNIDEIIGIRDIHEVPFRTNQVFRGLVNVGGELLICIDLANLIEAEETSGEQTGKVAKRMIVTRSEKERYVFAADEVQTVMKLKETDLKPRPATMQMKNISIIEKVLIDNGRTIGLVNDESFYSALKRSIIW